jgi:uncharacterized membrane protein
MSNRARSTEFVLSLALAFVLAWFGFSEVTKPLLWTTYVPTFLGTGSMITRLVMVHGFVLLAAAAGLVFNIWRRWAAILAALLLADIVINLWMQEGLSAITARDIGLFGAATALAILAARDSASSA